MISHQRSLVLLAALCVLCFATAAFAQIQTPRPSQKASVMQRIGVTDVTITYSRPAVKGRVVWGDPLPEQKAQGEATAFEKVYEQYRLAPEVTRRRMYYETMERILQSVDKTVIEAPGVVPYQSLPAPKLSQPQTEGANK